MWPTFERESEFWSVDFSKAELIVVSMMWGFTMGFAYFVTYHAIQLTRRLKRFNTFIMLVWLEIIACLPIYGVLGMLLICGVIQQDNLWIWLGMVTSWTIALQCQIQIIVNRVCILVDDPTTRRWLKLGMFFWVGVINVSVATIWIPAMLQINSRWRFANTIYDPIEKVLYLLTDAGLNYFFIRTVQNRLVSSGLTKYNKLLHFNKMIIWVSVSMDLAIFGSLFLENPLVYVMVHPLAFMIKLEIEMTMSNLIVLIATGSGIHIDEFDSDNSSCDRVLNPPSTIRSVRVEVRQEAVTDFDGDEISLQEVAKHSQIVLPTERPGVLPIDQLGDDRFHTKPSRASSQSDLRV